MRRGRDERNQLDNQLRDSDGCHFPDSLMIDVAVFVGQHVPLGNDAAPWDFRVSCLKSLRDFSCRFTKDFNRPFHSQLAQPILPVLFPSYRSDKTLDVLGGC